MILVPTQNLSYVESVYSKVSLDDLNNDYASFLNWVTFLNKYLSEYGSSERLNKNDEIIVIGLSYFQQVTDLIKEYQKDVKKERTLRMCVIFHLIKFSLPLLSKEYRNQYNAIGEALTGKDKFIKNFF